MTELGKAFANTASTILRLHGMGSKKMVAEYQLEADSGEIYCKYDSIPYLEQLVEMGYLRKFIGSPYKNNKGRNWRYRFMVRNVNFGLTEKGWEVAERYIIAAYGAAEYKRLVDSWEGVTRWNMGDSVEGIDDWDDFVN